MRLSWICKGDVYVRVSQRFLELSHIHMISEMLVDVLFLVICEINMLQDRISDGVLELSFNNFTLFV
jgi:hypothetical protein